MLPIILRLCFYALFLFLWNTVSAQQVRYNRIQHKNYKWYVLPVKDATVYFPEQHDSLAVFTTRWIEPIKKEVSVLMGKTTSKVPNIIIYPSGSRMYESNAGIPRRIYKLSEAFLDIDVLGRIVQIGRETGCTGTP